MEDFDDDFDAEVEQLRARRAAAESAMRDAFARSPAILVTEGDRDELWILSGQTNPEEEGDWRISFLWADGPGGHRSGDDVEDLVRELAVPWATYKPVDESFVIRWTTTPTWKEGALKVAYVQAFNHLQSLAARHDAREWAWQRILASKAETDIQKATRILELAMRDLEAGRAPNAVDELRQRLMPPA